MTKVIWVMNSIIVLLVIVVTYLIWKANGDLLVWFCFGIPMVALRLWKAILHIDIDRIHSKRETHHDL